MRCHEHHLLVTSFPGSTILRTILTGMYHERKSEGEHKGHTTQSPSTLAGVGDVVCIAPSASAEGLYDCTAHSCHMHKTCIRLPIKRAES